MDRKLLTRILAGLLAAIMLLGLLPMIASAEEMTFVVEISNLDDKPKGTWKDGDTFKCGTSNYFTVFASATARIDDSEKKFSDGYRATKRLNFNSSSVFGEQILNAVQFKTTSSCKVGVWWVSGGNGREVAIFDQAGNILQQTTENSVKNSLYIATFELAEPGTYYIANIGGNNNYSKIEVTESDPIPPEPRAPWDEIAAPVITSVKDTGDGRLEVKVEADVSNHGADEVVVTMYSRIGAKLESSSSVLEKTSHTLYFAPASSGEYVFKATLKRYAEEDKKAEKEKGGSFTLPLASPILSSATSKGNGTVELVFTACKEAEVYEILVDGKVAAETRETSFTVEGLTVGQKYRFQIAAVRGKTRSLSETADVTATQDAKVAWGFTHYGPSTNDENNGFEGSVNEDGFVTVYSENGKGKIVPASVDGLSFYYTAVPTELNFTLRAKVTVDSWSYSNGQEGFGLMACDRLGASGDSSNFWNNQFMAVATKIEYRYDPDTMQINNDDGVGTKYSMKLGLGTVAKTGVTAFNLSRFNANDTAAINEEFLSRVDSLEGAAGEWGKEKGTYNIIGNCTNEVTGSIETALLTEFDLQIQKNNTGYFITYYAPDGSIAYQRKFYGADALNQLDEKFVYVGFIAARNARATFCDIQFTTIPASEDAPAEEKPVTRVQPTLMLMSPTVTTSRNYTLALDANVAGTAEVKVAGQVVAENVAIPGGERFTMELTLPEYGENRLQVTFQPDETQDLGEDTVLENTNKLYVDETVVCNQGFGHRKTLFVGPQGTANGDASREYPLDIYTAVNMVLPGQTIVLLEGEYHLRENLRIQRGMDGTESAPIRMIADPEAKSRPVLDFQGVANGMVHGGDWWYFAGFDVTNSAPTQKGFQVSGNHNTLDNIHAYRCGNTGIQLSRYSGADLFPDWPSNNLILNCESYYNADPGEEDADGFAAKLTCGEGNVFDGCVAHHNADDGWDLYAKVETGSIGAVTIRNCVAYANGLREGDIPGEGNGNGFKMGGESLSGKHILENSIAFGNKAKGIDSNSCPDIIVKNSVSYNNGSYNVALYTNNAADTAFLATGIVSFRDASSMFPNAAETADNFKVKGSQRESDYLGETNYYWGGKASANDVGAAITAESFESLTFQGIARKADGSLDLKGFLEVNSLGIALGGTASMDQKTLESDGVCTYAGEWFTRDPMVHWQSCECGNRGNYGAHTLKWVIDQEPTREKAGLKHQTCTVCGYHGVKLDMQYGEELDLLGEDGGSNAGLIVIAVGVVICLAGAGFAVMKKKKK